VAVAKRSFFAEDGALGPGRLSIDDTDVRALIREIAGEATAVDLGGTMSLNAHLTSADLVLRVHRPFITRRRILAARELLRGLLGCGISVPEPRRWRDQELFRCWGRWAELEAFIAHSKPPPTWGSYVWMYGAMGRLHRSMAPLASSLPRPAVATYGPPGTLRRWARVTADAVQSNSEAAGLADRLKQLIRRLERQWVPARHLPMQLVHGDVRLGNVAAAPGGEPVYLDFGFAAIRPRIHDLGYALSWIVLRPDDSGRAEDFQWDRLPELVTAYEDSSQTTLSPIERRALGPYMAAVPLYLASISGFIPDPVRRLLEERPFLRIAEWVLANPESVAL